MAQYSIPNQQSIATAGFNFNCDRKVILNNSGTIKIYDNNNNLLKTINATDPEVSLKEG